MTDHIVSIEGTFEILCSCGEELGEAGKMPVEEAGNLRWQHLVKHMTPIPPEPSTAVTFNMRDWKKWRIGG
jgi:hypothetical protein